MYRYKGSMQKEEQNRIQLSGTYRSIVADRLAMRPIHRLDQQQEQPSGMYLEEHSSR